METKKLSFAEWIKNHNEGYPNGYVIAVYDNYQKYLIEPEKKSLKWEDTIKKGSQLFYINSDSSINKVKVNSPINIQDFRNCLPTCEIAEQELVRMQWIMIAWKANDGEDWEEGYCITKSKSVDVREIVSVHYNPISDGTVKFKMQELCQQAYEENKEIVHQMLGITL